MRGLVHIKVGRYQLADHVTLSVHASDSGTAVSIEDQAQRAMYSAVITETGELAWHNVAYRRGESPPAPKPKSATPVTSLPEDDPIGGGGSRKARVPKRIRFIIKYGPSYRPRNHAFVLAGFMAKGKHVHILYRVAAAGVTHYEDQLRVFGSKVARGDDIPKQEQLPKKRWPKLLEMPEQTIFGLKRMWRKMSDDELRPMIEGRTFQVVSYETPDSS